MRAEDAEDYERPKRQKATPNYITQAQTATAKPAVTQKGNTSGTVAPFNYQAPRFQGGQFGQPYHVPNAPQFYAPPFLLPRGEDVFNDPSYQFRLNEGLKALERSAAAKGTLRTGNTLEDLMRYGQDYASQEYGKAVDRTAQQYGLNYNATRDMYAPGLLTWQAQNEVNTSARDQAAQQAWQEYVFRIDDEWRREQALLNAGLA